MLPPTGLTFIVHGIIILFRSSLQLFGLVFPKNIRHGRQSLQTSMSVAIIALVAIYTSWLIGMFVERSINDRYSNWNVIDRTVASVKESFGDTAVTNATVNVAEDVWNIDVIPEVLPADVSQETSQYPATVNMLITSKYFTESASPYVVQYAEDFKVIYQFMPLLFNKI